VWSALSAHYVPVFQVSSHDVVYDVDILQSYYSQPLTSSFYRNFSITEANELFFDLEPIFIIWRHPYSLSWQRMGEIRSVCATQGYKKNLGFKKMFRFLDF